MSSTVSKQFLEVAGIPVLARTLLAFENTKEIDEIIVVARQSELALVGEIAARWHISKLAAVVAGGDTRAASVKNGFLHVHHAAKFVAIHDAARCLITAEMIDSVLEAAYTYRCAAAASRCVDTMKIADETGLVSKTIDRNSVWRVFTPQTFEKSFYLAAAYMAKRDEATVTDDCSLIERLGGKIKLVEVGSENIKLTHPSDRDFAEFILKKRGEDK